MKHYKTPDGTVYAFEEDGSQDDYIKPDMVRMTDEEVESHVNPPKTDEQLREEWKACRAAAVGSIKVTTLAGNTFDGDEISQGRMARAISSMDDGDEVVWVLADSTPIMATKSELKEALKLAGSAQASIWVQP